MPVKSCAVCGLDTNMVGIPDPWDIYEVSVGGRAFGLCLCCLGGVTQSLLDKNPDFDMSIFWMNNHCGIRKIGE